MPIAEGENELGLADGKGEGDVVGIVDMVGRKDVVGRGDDPVADGAGVGFLWNLGQRKNSGFRRAGLLFFLLPFLLGFVLYLFLNRFCSLFDPVPRLFFGLFFLTWVATLVRFGFL